MPVPILTVFPNKVVKLVSQSSWSGPAFESVAGGSLNSKITVSIESEHTGLPFETVQVNS